MVPDTGGTDTGGTDTGGTDTGGTDTGGTDTGGTDTGGTDTGGTDTGGTGGSGSDTALTLSFSDIAASGLSNACYLDDDHYVAEFLYQNPDVCFWETDSANQTVTAVATPTAPIGAIQIPEPSGGDDTSMLESFINTYPGQALVGAGNLQSE